MSPRFGHVVLGGRIRPEGEEPPQDRGEDPRAKIWGQRVAKDRAAQLGRDFDGVDLFAGLALRQDGLAGRTEVAHPVDLPEW